MTFLEELEAVINKHNMEGGSDTPGFILAEYLTECLTTFDTAIKKRTKFYCSNVKEELENK